MRKGWIIAGVVAAILVGGGFGVKYYVTEKIGEEVVKMAEDPDVQKAIDDAIAKGTADQNVGDLLKAAEKQAANGVPAGTTVPAQTTIPETSGQGTSSSNKGETAQKPADKQTKPKSPEIENRSEAVSYAMKKFSTSEVSHYMQVYADRANMTAAEKSQIKSEILSRFTAEELKALQEAAQK